MKCMYCGGIVVWVYPMFDGVSKCTECDMPNSQELDNEDEEFNMYVYINSEKGLWTVGFYLGDEFNPETDWTDPMKAARRVAFLNGNGFKNGSSILFDKEIVRGVEQK